MVVLQSGILYELSNDVFGEIYDDIQDTRMVYHEYVLFHDLPKTVIIKKLKVIY